MCIPSGPCGCWERSGENPGQDQAVGESQDSGYAEGHADE